tara:strand:+ start:2036 stop:3316 length:1281 start_codon:yes stop_codon:yes gene_type:complete
MKKPIANKIQINDYLNRAGKPVKNKRHVITDNVKLTLELRCRNWYTRFRVEGKQTNISLRTSDLQTAAARAVDQAEAALNGNWGAVHTSAGKAITIGEIITIYIATAYLRDKQKTRNDNADRLRKFIRTVKGIKRTVVIDDDGVKTEPAIDKLPATILDGKLVERYQSICLNGIAEGSLQEDAKRAADTQLGNVRGIFSKPRLTGKNGKGIYPNLPESISTFLSAPGLNGIKKTFKYNDIAPFCSAAFARLPELKKSDPAAYLLARLAICCGLRRSEATEARKSWIGGKKGNRTITVQMTDSWVPKGRQEGEIALPEDLYDEIEAITDTTEYIVPATSSRKPTSLNERNHGLPRRLCNWIAETEVDGVAWPFAKKLHELRKWFGAQVASQAGLYAAQKVLRHSDYKTTADYYADLTDAPEYTIKVA